jgi:hypothetical protein
MSRPCSICHHPKREAIDKALLDGTSTFRSLAKRFGVTTAPLWRHQKTHLAAALARGLAAEASGQPVDPHARKIAEHAVAVEVKQERQAIDTVQQLRAINAACLEVLREARSSGKSMMLLQAVDRIARQIELQAKLLGQIQDGATVNVAVLPEWHGIRHVVLQALVPHPEARLAVAEALKGWSA